MALPEQQLQLQKLERTADAFCASASTFLFRKPEVTAFLRKIAEPLYPELRDELIKSGDKLEDAQYSRADIGRLLLRVCTDMDCPGQPGQCIRIASHPDVPEEKQQRILQALMHSGKAQKTIAEEEDVDTHVVQRLRAIYLNEDRTLRDTPLRGPSNIKRRGRPKKS